MPPVDKDLTAPAWMEKAPLSPNSLYPAELNPSPGAPVMFGPNISGQVQLERPLLPTDKIKTGPFSTAWKGSYRQSFEGSYGSSGNDTIVFKANSASSIFGQGTTVQPASVRFLPAIKF